MTKALIIFAKDPDESKVKTRLAEDIGQNKAAEVYKLLLQHTIESAKSSKFDLHVFYANNCPKLIPEMVPCHKQEGDDLGERMMNAFNKLFDSYTEVALIGSDCYSLKKSHIREAFKGLEESDVVFGPAYDGGYYLVAMKKLHIDLFKEIEWSTETVLEDSLDKLLREGLSFRLLDTLRDIDTIDDLAHYPKLMKAVNLDPA